VAVRGLAALLYKDPTFGRAPPVKPRKVRVRRSRVDSAPDTETKVWDSSGHCDGRLPERPAGTEYFTDEMFVDLVTTECDDRCGALAGQRHDKLHEPAPPPGGGRSSITNGSAGVGLALALS